MAKTKKRRVEFKDPRSELPQAPAMQAGLKVEHIEQHRRGEHRAKRGTAWDTLRSAGLITLRQHQAADAYAERAAEQLGSPAPKSCLDFVTPGYDNAEPTNAEIRAYLEWRAMHKGMPSPVQNELRAVLWGGHSCRDVAALRAGLDAVSAFLNVEG